MTPIAKTIAIAAASLLLLAGCGDDDDGAQADQQTSSVPDDASQDDAAQDDTGQDDGVTDTDGGGDADVVVTVDGTEYPMTIVQTCQTERDEARSTDLTMFGFAESGERVELSFRYQDAESSPTGTEQYYGSVGIASGELSAQITSDEPFDFLEGDRSTVTGSVTMETTGSSPTPVEVEFTISCP